jgi:hypothetical protein
MELRDKTDAPLRAPTTASSNWPAPSPIWINQEDQEHSFNYDAAVSIADAILNQPDLNHIKTLKNFFPTNIEF